MAEIQAFILSISARRSYGGYTPTFPRLFKNKWSLKIGKQNIPYIPKSWNKNITKENSFPAEKN